MRSRLDVEMTRRGLSESRESAQRLIMAGRVRVNSRPAAKPDLRVDSTAEIVLVGAQPEYASRGGYKLAAALDHFVICVDGRHALDVGGVDMPVSTTAQPPSSLTAQTLMKARDPPNGMRIHLTPGATSIASPGLGPCSNG